MIYIINIIFQILNMVIWTRVILSWIPHDPNHFLIKIIYEISNPILSPIQKMIPPIGGKIDASPIIAIVIIQFLKGVILSFLYF